MNDALRTLAPDAFPNGARAAAKRILDAGGSVNFVGGAVRDLLLDREVHDYDLATNLKPEALARLFPRTHSVGARFGTVLVIERSAVYEITTFRRDGLYTDGRRPDAVEWADTIEEDLARRDFTINAMACDPTTGAILDPFGGLRDLEARVIRAVGDPERRFGEDGLRLFRAVRFASQLDFEIEPATLRGLVVCAPMLEKIAPERVRDEFDKLLAVERPSSGLALLHETGLLRRFLPELAACYGVPQNPHHAYDVFHHSLAAVDRSERGNPVVRLAALFHDLGKPETRVQLSDTASFHNHQYSGERMVDRIMRRLRYPNETRERVMHLVRHHMFHYTADWTDGAVRRFLRTIGPENVDELFLMRAADTMGNGLRRRLAPELVELRKRADAILEAESALSVRDLAVGGTDLMQDLGLSPGPIIGRILHALLDEVLDDPTRNTREHLLSRARQLALELNA